MQLEVRAKTKKQSKPNAFKRFFTRKRNLNRTIWGDLGLFILLAGFGFFSAYPLIMTASNAFKPLDELFLFPPKLLPRNLTLGNFKDLFELIGNSWVPFSRYFFNTIFVTEIGRAHV